MFDLTPTKPLAKIYTLGMIVKTILLWLKEEHQIDLNGELVKRFINLGIMDASVIVATSGSDDYGKTANITDNSASFTTTIVTGAAYNDIKREITKPEHGYTAADVGRRIILWSGTQRAGQAEIESIIDQDIFKITKSFGASGGIIFAVLSVHISTSIDISEYRLINIVKITDSINGDVDPLGIREFENIARLDNKQKRVYYHKYGQYLFLKKGTEVSTIGTLTMFYNSYPQLHVDDDELVDIRDNYVPLVIEKAKQYCLVHLGKLDPEVLTSDKKVA